MLVLNVFAPGKQLRARGNGLSNRLYVTRGRHASFGYCNFSSPSVCVTRITPRARKFLFDDLLARRMFNFCPNLFKRDI